MTMRSRSGQWFIERRQILMSSLARRAMTTRTTGLDGLAKALLRRMGSKRTVEHDPELDHPEEWDRPID